MNTEAILFASIVALFIGAGAVLGWAAMDQHTELNTACIEHNGTFTQGMCIYGADRAVAPKTSPEVPQ